jgi:hypothetical protein
VSQDHPPPPADEWVVLSHRLPREPSTPRIAVWRRLKKLGVAQVADGLVALPADARTREQLEWVAEEVVEHGGDASVWMARPTAHAHGRRLAAAMAAARAQEYVALAEAAVAALDAAPTERRRTLERLRRVRREIARRDFFPPPEREHAARALDDLAEGVADDEAVVATGRVRTERGAVS